MLQAGAPGTKAVGTQIIGEFPFRENFDGSLAPNLGHRAIATPDPEAAIRALCLNRRKNLQGRCRFPKAPFVVPMPGR